MFHALIWTVLEPAASVATVLPHAPMQDHSTNLCSSHCISPVVSVISTRVRPLWLLTFSFALVLASALTRHAFAFAFVLFAFALARLAFGFVVRARPSTRWVVLHVFSFLSTFSRRVAVNSTP